MDFTLFLRPKITFGGRLAAMADGDISQLNGTENKEDSETSVSLSEMTQEGAGDAAEKVTTTEECVLDDKIIRQIEYYFGDINLPRDKFLQEQIKLKDGWVTLDVLLTFKRLASLTQDKPTIISALKKSPNNLLQISEDETEIRRDPERPLPEMNEERRKELMTRTLYFKGFPIETTLDEVLEFFNKITRVENVIMRGYKDKALNVWKFKGSIFAVFPSRDAADEFLKRESVKFGDDELIKMWQKDYIESKRQQRLDLKVQKKKNNPEDEDDKEDDKDDGFPKNAVLHLSECPSDLTRELIKEKMEELDASVAFVDYNKGDTEGWVRLQDEGKALEVLEKVEEGKLKIGENNIAVRALEGEEETKFLEKVKADIAKRRNQSHKGRRGRRGGFGGRGNYGRKRRGSPISNRGTPAKVAATGS